MKRTIYCLAVMLMCSMAAQAQKEFTLEDLNFGGKNYANMVPQNRTLAWCGNQLYHMEKDSCWTVDLKSGKEKLAFTAQQVRDWAGLDANTTVNLKWASFPYGDRPLLLVYTHGERLLVDVKRGIRQGR